MTRCSVIIPTYNRPEALAQCLDALARQTFRDFEVIVCDDGSEPEAASRIASLCAGSVLVRSPRLGPAGARNCAARAAPGEFLVFLDDDCLAEPGWLAQLLAGIKAGQLVAGQTVNGYPDNLPSEIGELILEVGLETFTPGPGSLYFFRSTNLALARCDFETTGGWNENFRTAEDREFCHRWQLAGGGMVRVPTALVRHQSYLSLAAFARRHFEYGRGAFHFHRRRGASGALDWSFLRFYAEVWRAIGARASQRPAARLLFCLWQAMNVSGFLREMAGGLLAPKRPGNAPKYSPPGQQKGDASIAERSAANPA